MFLQKNTRIYFINYEGCKRKLKKIEKINPTNKQFQLPPRFFRPKIPSPLFKHPSRNGSQISDHRRPCRRASIVFLDSIQGLHISDPLDSDVIVYFLLVYLSVLIFDVF